MKNRWNRKINDVLKQHEKQQENTFNRIKIKKTSEELLTKRERLETPEKRWLFGKEIEIRKDKIKDKKNLRMW